MEKVQRVHSQAINSPSQSLTLESNFRVYCDVDSVQRNLYNSKSDLIYPKFPLQHTDKYEILARQLSYPAKTLLEHLSVDVQKLNRIGEHSSTGSI